MNQIIAIDFSMTSTGMARIDHDGKAECWSVESKGKIADDLAARSDRVRRLANRILDLSLDYSGETSDPTPTEVIVESPSYGSTGRGTWDRAGLWWSVVAELTKRGVPVHMAAPSTVKKWIAGSGRAEKNTVGVNVGRIFPDVEIHADDEADALAMAHIVAVRAGILPPARATQNAEAWAAVKWAS